MNQLFENTNHHSVGTANMRLDFTKRRVSGMPYICALANDILVLGPTFHYNDRYDAIIYN